MNRSADAIGPRDVTPWRDVNRSHLPELSTMSEPARAPAASTEDAVLLEILIPVHAKLEDREEVRRNLGVFVQTGRGGVNGLSRRVCVRLTDPSDPFFLFELELLEDDYGSFKQRLELLVDFSGFPKYLVSMLSGVVTGVTPYNVCFVVDSRDTMRGTLRVLERTEFRTVEHISLVLLRQGDAGQKRYLAERFQHFERAFNQATEERRVEAAQAAANIEALRSEVATLEESRAALREQLNLEMATWERSQMASVSQLREEHSSQLIQLRNSLESELHRVTRKAEEVQKQLLEDVRVKDKELHEARQRNASLESSAVAMQSQLRVLGDKCNAQAMELEGLRSANDELQNFRSQATRSLSDNELNCVKLQERLRALVHTLKSRDDELKSLREQYHKQDNYICIITSQNEQLVEQKKKSESSISKAHHIISSQLKHMKGVKERERMMRSQLRSQDALLQEKEKSIARLREELATSTERAQVLQNKSAELRDQLEKTDAAREKLVQELKQSQDALIHLQRSTSVNGRYWSIMPSTATATTTAAGSNNNNNNNVFGAGLNGGFGSAPYDVYREFHKNASTTLRTDARKPGCVTSDVDLTSSTQLQSLLSAGVTTAHQSDGASNNSRKAAFHLPNGSGVNKPEKSATRAAVAAAASGDGVNGASAGQIVDEGQLTTGKGARQPLDPATINVAFNQTNRVFASKSFLTNGTNQADLSANTASFVEKFPLAAAAASPSAYF